ncbi:MAG: acetate kinase [Phycisphaerales bacterium]|nr:acetate kinase [Phycisphaerales bacterium]
MTPSSPDTADVRVATDGAPAAGGQPAAHVVTVNGGSSSIKFAVFARGDPPARVMTGLVERIGSPDATLVATGVDGDGRVERRPVDVSDHGRAAELVGDWLDGRVDRASLVGVGHRIVHGGPGLVEHQDVTDVVLAELRRARPLDLAHLPRELSLLDAFRARFAGVPQVACFDTAFHRDLPRVARLLPIPRRYDEAGVRRMGFHGLSFTYLMEELGRAAGPGAAEGRVILAHLGSGASMAAVRGGRPVDTTMGFTPTAGLVMGTRPGDLDPGLLTYLMRREGLTPEQADRLINERCGLLGVSGTSSDMRDLVGRRGGDVRAAEAVELFCYQARKFVGGFAAALGGLDTLVFAGGIGERSPEVRDEICRGLGFLGVRLDGARNGGSAPVISADDSRVGVRVIPTDEEVVIARTVFRLHGGRTGS